MSKLIWAEFKKIFYNPFIFVVSGFLIAALALTAVIYKPITKESSLINIEGANVGAIVATFNGNGTQSKNEFYKYFVNAQNLINNYLEQNTTISDLQFAINSLTTKHDAYSLAHRTYGEDSAIVESARVQYKSAYETLNNQWTNSFAGTTTKAIVNNDIYTQFLAFINECLSAFNDSATNKNTFTINKLSDLQAIVKISSYMENVKLFQPTAQTLTDCLTYLNLAQQNLTDIQNKINTFSTQNSASEKVSDKKQINLLITNYKLTAQMSYEITNSSLFLSAVDSMSNSQLNTYKHFEDINLYNENEMLAQYIYLLENNQFNYEYNNVFSLNRSSGNKVNAFDYVYFALQIFIFIIIIFMIVIGAGTIAGEKNAGTMKQLAIRPFKRSKLLTGKIIATLMIGIVLLVISYVVCLIAGLILFGIPSSPVLAVFNGVSAFKISAFALSLIHLLSLILELLFYSILAISLSVLIKNHTASVAISMMIYFITIVVSSITNMGSTVWALNLFTPINANLFKFFGGSFVGTNYMTVLTSLITTPIVINSNFVTALVGNFATCAILLIGTYSMFINQDIK